MHTRFRLYFGTKYAYLARLIIPGFFQSAGGILLNAFKPQARATTKMQVSRNFPPAYYDWYAQRLEGVRDVYEAHVAFAAVLKDALEHGCALADAFDRKATRIRYGHRLFEDDTAGFRDVLERALVRRQGCRTGAAKLRCALDTVVTAHVDHTFEAMLAARNVMSLYFGWRFERSVRLAPCPWMRMGDVGEVARFVRHCRAALAAADDVWVPWQQRRVVGEAVEEHRSHLQVLEDMAQQFAATYIQRAWRRARDAPGYSVWRRRMLREFNDLSADM